MGIEPVDERFRIEIRDRANEPRERRVSRGSLSTGVKPAAAMLRRTSSTDVRRLPERLVVDRRDAIEIVGAEGQRHLRELRSVLRPVHLDVLHRWQHQPRQRHRAHILVAGRRHRDRLLARQRVHRVDRRETSSPGRADASASSNGRRPRSGSAATGSAPAVPRPRQARERVFGIVQPIDRRFRDRVETGALQPLEHVDQLAPVPIGDVGQREAREQLRPASIRASAISASASSSVAGSGMNSHLRTLRTCGPAHPGRAVNFEHADVTSPCRRRERDALRRRACRATECRTTPSSSISATVSASPARARSAIARLIFTAASTPRFERPAPARRGPVRPSPPARAARAPRRRNPRARA